jgi:methylase of polypeptide subunit release factors
MTDEAWIDALQQRHRAALTNSEFLKAVRALSARYVERRSSIRERSPLDSDGKKAAFAAFYAPLHFLTSREIVRQLSLHEAPISRIVDLGCGTGVVSAAWALDYARAGARDLRDTPGISLACFPSF